MRVPWFLSGAMVAVCRWSVCTSLVCRQMSLVTVMFVDGDTARQAVFSLYVSSLFSSLVPPSAKADGGCCHYLWRLSKKCAADRKPCSWPLSQIGCERMSSTSDEYRTPFCLLFPIEQVTSQSNFLKKAAPVLKSLIVQNHARFQHKHRGVEWTHVW